MKNQIQLKMNYMKLRKQDKAGNDINEKTKYIDELKEIQEKFDYQNNKAKERKNKLNEKNKNIKTLENNIKDSEDENIRIITKSNKNYEIYNKKNTRTRKRIRRK